MTAGLTSNRHTFELTRFSLQMKKKRCAMGLSQKDFAELLKLSLSTYNNYERGIRTPRSVEIVRIAHILGVSTDWLLDEECNDGGNIKCANGY